MSKRIYCPECGHRPAFKNPWGNYIPCNICAKKLRKRHDRRSITRKERKEMIDSINEDVNSPWRDIHGLNL